MRPHHREVIAFLESIGAIGIRLEPARNLGHPRLVFHWRGREWCRAVAATPSCRRATANQISELRRDLGLVSRERVVGERRKRRPTKHVSASPVIGARRRTPRPPVGPFNTPFAALADLLP